jgi:hypothetical protein
MVTEREGGNVPVGYLVGVGLVALPTLFALVPRRSSPNLSFRLGLLLNEVPIAGLYWLLVWTALAFAQGDINTAGGDPGRRNLLDLYRHRARPSGSPVLIHPHGGGYYRGRKNSQSLPCSTGSPAKAGSVSARTTACGLPPGTPTT